MDSTKDPMLTPEQIAERLAVKRNHVYAMIRAGELEAVNVGVGKRIVYRVYESVLQAWLDGRRQT